MQGYLNIDDFEQAARFWKRRCGATGQKRTLEGSDAGGGRIVR